MKKIIFLLMVMPLACSSIAQDKFPFLAKNIEEFQNPQRDPAVKNVRTDNADMIWVKKNGGAQEYDMGDVWGFRDKYGNEYRVFNGTTYRLMETGRLCIYCNVVDVTTIDEGRTQATELNPTAEVKYYFSRRLGGDIYELNEANLAKVFSPTNEKFVDLLKNCKHDDNLIKYDRKGHDYKVEELYKESKNNPNS